MKQATASARQGIATKDASERSEASHANGASRRSGSRESVSGSPRGEAPRRDSMTDLTQAWPRPSHPHPIAIIGAGAIVRTAHLPVYRRLGYPVAGVYV